MHLVARSLLLALGIVMLTVGTLAQGSSGAPYEIKSGILTWNTTTAFAEGYTLTTTLYFDDYGIKQRAETVAETTVDGVTMRDTHIVVISDGYRYIFSRRERIGKKRTGAKPHVWMEFDDGSGMISKFNITVENFTAEVEGKEVPLASLPDSVFLDSTLDKRPVTMLGHACDLVEIRDGDMIMRNAAWKGLTMIFENEREGTPLISVRATDLKENAKIAPAMFAIPKDKSFFSDDK